MYPTCDECGESEFRDPFTDDPLDPCFGCTVGFASFIADMRRYLYRNVACEARKASDIAKHLPDVPGWM